jgi:very-short-patch-repair endonuclease
VTHPILQDLAEALCLSALGDASPIERHMFAGLVAEAIEPSSEDVILGVEFGHGSWEPHLARSIESYGYNLTRLAMDEVFSPCQFRVNGSGFALFPEFPIGKYRADFAFIGYAGRLALECDGHDFHERTKEQAAHDRKRDRWMLSQGWTVLRFTGSEIHKSPRGCAVETFAALDRLVESAMQRDMAVWDAQHSAPDVNLKPSKDDL